MSESEDERQRSGSDAEDDEEEYEIEAILDYDPKFFGKSPGYFVKWKGYPDSDNSWVKEEDAEGARELIADFMNRWHEEQEQKKTKKSPRKSEGPTTTHKKGRQSEIGTTKTSGTGSSANKRRRQSEPNTVISVDDSDDVENDVGARQPIKKKARTVASTPEAPTADNASDLMDFDMDSIGPVAQQLREQPCWEHLIRTIDTVERDPPTEQLMIYFTLKNGTRCREPSKVSKEKFPRLMIDFYEANLKWRSTGGKDKDKSKEKSDDNRKSVEA